METTEAQTAAQTAAKTAKAQDAPAAIETVAEVSTLNSRKILELAKKFFCLERELGMKKRIENRSDRFLNAKFQIDELTTQTLTGGMQTWKFRWCTAPDNHFSCKSHQGLKYSKDEDYPCGYLQIFSDEVEKLEKLGVSVCKKTA
eukprot:GHVP01040759.1.p1 GENE.GHVP01040759.1~~GHVP01040759.1.p1  ORF type:complete len:145 (-),score=29.00 GHVP01040759.1:52-486(-)